VRSSAFFGGRGMSSTPRHPEGRRRGAGNLGVFIVVAEQFFACIVCTGSWPLSVAGRATRTCSGLRRCGPQAPGGPADGLGRGVQVSLGSPWPVPPMAGPAKPGAASSSALAFAREAAPRATRGPFDTT
jgi:hypothetical protein